MTIYSTDMSGPGVQINYGPSESHSINRGVLIHSSGDNTVVSTQNLSRLSNSGFVSSGANRGVFFSGNDGYLFNAGGGWIVAYQDAVYSDGDRPLIENAGNIISINGSGVLFGTSSEDHVLLNDGDIQGHVYGVRDFASATGGTIKNSRAISGDKAGIDIFTSDGLVTTVINRAGGNIFGLEAGITSTSSGRLSLTNRGGVGGGIDLNADEASAADVIQNFGRIAGQVFLGNGNDTYNGPAGSSGKVSGEDGADKLFGGKFIDRFDGGLGNDVLMGRGGRDFFHFDMAIIGGLNVDTVKGFVHGQDEFVLDDDIFLGLTPGALTANRFVAGAFTNGVQRIALLANGTLVHDANGSLAGGNPSPFAKVAPNTHLTHIDFTIIA